MPELAAGWWAWAAPVAVQALLLAVAAEILHRLFARSLAPEVRLVLWGAALARLLVPPSLGLPWSPAAAAIPPSRLAESAPGSAGLPLLLGAWAAGALALGGLVVLRHARLCAALARSAHTHPVPAGLAREIQAAAREIGLSRAPRASFLARATGPAVVGVLRPVIALPRGFAALPREERRHALLHELAHVRRGDPWLGALALAIRCLWWPHPAAWLAQRRFCAALELACDERVARLLGPDAPRYRRTLLRAADRVIGPDAGGPALALHHAAPATILLRLDRLEHPVWMRSRGARTGAWIAGAALALALAPAASLERVPLVADAVLQARAVLEAAARGERQSCFQKHFAVGVLARAGEPLVPTRHEGVPR